MNKALLFLIVAATIISVSCNNTDSETDNTAITSTPILNYSVVATYPHDTSSFTQGLTFYNNQLLEGTGLNGKSKLMYVNLETGHPEKAIQLDSTYFGEGITVLNDTIYQLTWQNKVVLAYTKDFKKVKEYSINTEGWGITSDSTQLIVSDGSSNLYFYEPSTFRLLRSQSVTENGSPVVNLNELEFINGYVYANQWQYNNIVKIDPASGQVVAKLDFTEVVNRVRSQTPQADFLNGIAYNPQTQKIYITGKLWPQIFEVRFEH